MIQSIDEEIMYGMPWVKNGESSEHQGKRDLALVASLGAVPEDDHLQLPVINVEKIVDEAVDILYNKHTPSIPEMEIRETVYDATVF